MRVLQELEGSYILKVSSKSHMIESLGHWRESNPAAESFEGTDTVYTNSGRLWGDRLLALKGVRVSNTAGEVEMGLETTEVIQTVYLLTNIPGIDSLTA